MTMPRPAADDGKDNRALAMTVGDAIFTQRSIRRMRPDPIPVGHLRLIVAAASKAPNGGNHQIGRLLVVTDRDKIAAFGALYHRSWWAKRKEDRGWNGPEDVPPGDVSMASAMRLADEMTDVPCVVFVCSEPPHDPDSVLPAAQNLMLAARALGIGSVPTRLHPGHHGEFRALFGVPGDIGVHLAIPLGYPRGQFGATSRLPTAETTHWNRWGGTVPWA
jgi:nitroreductase